MAKILTIQEMLYLAEELDMCKHDTFTAVIQAANHLADALADRLGVIHNGATYEGSDMEGLCVPFYPVHEGQDPGPLDAYDKGGDWGIMGPEVTDRYTRGDHKDNA